jgi:uncharacterized BrkB/YihY/UPF0761 family membrane protein
MPPNSNAFNPYLSNLSAPSLGALIMIIQFLFWSAVVILLLLGGAAWIVASVLEDTYGDNDD